jgi:fructose-1,6-bisphosphatase I
VPNIITVESHIQSLQAQHPGARGEFSGLLRDIAFAAKIISHHVNRAGLVDILGATGSVNVQGEAVQKLDLYAHEVMARVVGRGGRVCLMASEEREDPIPVEKDGAEGDYVLLFDPLDGSSNIDVNVSIGTIFSILRRVSPSGGPVREEDLLQAGHRQEAAGYVIYGSSTMLVLAAGEGHGVHGFTLDPTVGEFLLSHENIRMPARASIYSANEGHAHRWPDPVRRLVAGWKEPRRERPALTARYIGSLVADFHRNLLKGGIFLYPSLRNLRGGPDQPKLRLMYEANPLAFVAHHAGGYASDGHGAILDLEPHSLHQRVPLLLGSLEDVHDAEEFLKREGQTG